MIPSHFGGKKVFPTKKTMVAKASRPESSADANPKIFKVRMLTQTVKTLVVPLIPNSHMIIVNSKG